VVAVERRSERRANARRLDEILVRDGQAMQHADRPAARDGVVGCGGGGHRLVGHERDDRVDFRVDAFDLREVRAQDFARRHLLASEPRRQIDRVHLAELVRRGLRRRLRRVAGRAEGAEGRGRRAGGDGSVETPAADARVRAATVGRFRAIEFTHASTPVT
jgi:hypothetical protein